MPYLTAIDKPLYWTAQNGAVNVISDIAEIGGNIGIPPTMTYISNTDQNAYLGDMVGKGGVYNPLPQTGDLCITGLIYSYMEDLVICRQTHTRTIYAPSDTPALFSVYRVDGGMLAWVANERVLIGDQRTYLTKTYYCIQAHTTQVDWTPDQTPTMWTLVPVGTEWAYPVAYKINDVITYIGKSYKCLQGHTSQAGWTPVAVPALWKLV